MIDDNFVFEKVRALFQQFVKEHGALSPPVDPRNLKHLCGVLEIDYRRMVPEGVLTPVRGGFAIYLQNNFIALHRKNARERFTLAHELAHTFFYDRNQPVPKPMKGTPRGQRLERLCHLAANEILLPTPMLIKELEKKGKIASTEALLDLATLFEVSLEMLIRRLHRSRLIEEERFAAILVDSVHGKQTIRTQLTDLTVDLTMHDGRLRRITVTEWTATYPLVSVWIQEWFNAGLGGVPNRLSISRIGKPSAAAVVFPSSLRDDQRTRAFAFKTKCLVEPSLCKTAEDILPGVWHLDSDAGP